MIRTLLREYQRRLQAGEPREKILKAMGGKFAQCDINELRAKLSAIVARHQIEKKEALLDNLLAGTPYGRN